MGQKQKTEKKKEIERKLVITMAKLRMAHASTHGARMVHAWCTQAAWAKNCKIIFFLKRKNSLNLNCLNLECAKVKEKILLSRLEVHECQELNSA